MTEITSKLVEIKAKYPIDNIEIEHELSRLGYTPLRWAIVKVQGDTLTISLACLNL